MELLVFNKLIELRFLIFFRRWENLLYNDVLRGLVFNFYRTVTSRQMVMCIVI